ncbi:MAG TPA: small basic family protein [Bacillota bacterium]|nr:small basic family protein [Candidatus Fermentithermobacillaceae bacterium]HOB29919.1 small basic family protein [Bacillota bacterium]HOK63789.1 small basic family protein [Bacillota bacterium]HOL11523.1 small basic family protein [Bacillota bacterium]HOQ02580.1 small basic family protein [Bacillota bacterium]
MWYLIVALIIGIVLGLKVPWQIPPILARYLAVSLLAGIDTALGGLRASFEGEFDTTIFVTGFLGNTVLSAIFVYIGDVFGIELYLAAVVALGIRIFNNVGAIRRLILKNLTEKKQEQEIEESSMIFEDDEGK